MSNSMERVLSLYNQIVDRELRGEAVSRSDRLEYQRLRARTYSEIADELGEHDSMGRLARTWAAEATQEVRRLEVGEFIDVYKEVVRQSEIERQRGLELGR